jgi:uncharacterized protein
MQRQDDFLDVCSKCKGACCKGARPPLTSKRIQIINNSISNAVEIEDRSLQSKQWYCKKEYTYPKENSGWCIFLNSKKTCQIHAFKPETCIAGPITFDINFKKGVIEWYLKKETICPLAGELYKDKLKHHIESAKREIKILVKQLPKKELLAIMKIEEPETFKIGEDSLEL